MDEAAARLRTQREAAGISALNHGHATFEVGALRKNSIRFHLIAHHLLEGNALRGLGGHHDCALVLVREKSFRDLHKHVNRKHQDGSRDEHGYRPVPQYLFEAPFVAMQSSIEDAFG